MEWAVLGLFAAVAGLLVGWMPLAAPPAALDADALRDTRERLLRELRDLDEDAAAGRISEIERHDGRLALAPELRRVTEQLRESGESFTRTRERGAAS